MDPQDVVVAGSAGFIEALEPALALRLGGAPRVAATPGALASIRAAGARMLVYEHDGQPWLASFGPPSGDETVVVAALPPEQAGAVGEISRAVTAVVAWHGEGRPVLDAVARILAAREAALPAVVAPRRPAAPAAPVRSAPAPVRSAPARSVPAGPVPAGPVEATAPPPPPARVPPAPAATPPARPELEPLELVLPEPSSLDAIFDGAVEEEAVVEEPTHPIPSPAPRVEGVSSTWPGTVLPATEGLALVRAALAGNWPRPEFRSVTERVLGSLSPAERAAAQGEPLPCDGAPVCKAVGLRWQVAAAIDSLPPGGAPIDAAATQAILIGIDEVLAALKEVGVAAGPEAQRTLEPVRNGLVKEAIDLTEALSQVAPASMVEEITSTRKLPRAATPAPERNLEEVRTLRPPRGRDARSRAFPWALGVVLALAAIAAAAYHGYRFVNRGQGVASLPGAPSGTVGLATPQGKFVVAPPGVRLEPREVENVRALERVKGNEVREVAPGAFIATPAAGGKP